MLATETATQEEVMHIWFPVRDNIPEAYRDRRFEVKCSGNEFYIGGIALTEGAKDYVASRIKEMGEAVRLRRKKSENQPLSEFVASEAGRDAWGLPGL